MSKASNHRAPHYRDDTDMAASFFMREKMGDQLTKPVDYDMRILPV